MVVVEAVEGDKARLSSDGFVVLAWTWTRVQARRKAHSYSLEAAGERGKEISYRRKGQDHERDAYHDLDFLSWTGKDIISAP